MSAKDRVGDGFWHYPQCNQSGPPLYFCPNPPCPIGAPGDMTKPELTLNSTGTSLEVEYWVRNAYCIPPSDGGDIERPNASLVPYSIFVFRIDPDGTIAQLVRMAPYWEHGKATFAVSGACSRYVAVFTLAYFFGGLRFEHVASNIVGPAGTDALGLPCLNDPRSCPIPNSPGEPINVGSANMHYDETLFTVSQNTTPLTFSIAYNSRQTGTGPLGIGLTHTFAQTMKVFGGNPGFLEWLNERGESTIFHRGGNLDPPFLPIWPADATGSVTLNSGAGTYTYKDLDGTEITFGSASGEWRQTRDRWGNIVRGTYTSGALTGITDPEERVWTLAYTGGRLTSITDPSSNLWSFSYSGSGHLEKIADPFHTLATPWRQYAYVFARTGWPNLLATVRDDSGAVLEGHQYASSGAALSSWSGDTVVVSDVPQPGPSARDLITLSYDTPTTQTTVTQKISDTLSVTSVFTLISPRGRFLPTTIVGNCFSCGGGGDDRQTFVYENNRITSKTVGVDNSGGGGTDERVTTNFTYNGNGMVLTRTEAVGKPEQRVTSYAYGLTSWPGFATSITEPSAAKPGSNKVTTYSLNGPETILTSSVSGFLASTDTTPTVYTTTTTFDSKHRVISIAGPRSGQLTSMTYYSDTDATLNRRGRLATSGVQTQASPPTSLTTTLDNYDVFGTARTVTDPNGVETLKTTDSKGRVTIVTSKKPPTDPAEPEDYTTTYAFDPRDRLTNVTLPRLNSLGYVYEDGTNRLTETIRADSAGNLQERLRLTLNTVGGKTLEEAQVCGTPNPTCSGGWTTRRSDSFEYDIHNRLFRVVHPDSTEIRYTYDSRGNLKDVRDERHTTDANTLYDYDFLNRLKTVTQKQILVPGPDIVTQYAYDVHDNLTSVTDPNSNVTSYLYDDFGRMRRQTSPVSGVTNSTHDEAGNLSTSSDANGATATRTYDAANRVLTATSTRSGFPTETVTWTYDSSVATNYGKGRIATMTDPSGSASYAYERRGLLRSEAKTIQGDAYSQAYGYDANGNRLSVTYPSSRVVTYTFDFADRPLSAVSGGTSYVSSAAYEPFGPQKSVSFGNGTTQTMGFDNRYRVSQNKLVKDVPLMTLAEYNYVEDGVGNITQINDALEAGFNRTLRV